MTPKQAGWIGLRGRRRGMTLIEVVQMVAIIGFLSSMSVTVLAGSFRVHRSVLERYRELETSEQFARRWRADVARAVDVQLLAAEPEAEDENDRSPRLELTQQIDGQRYVIVYGVQGDLITRSRTREGEPAGEDRWPLPDGRMVRFSTEAMASGGEASGGGEATENILVTAQLDFANDSSASNRQSAKRRPVQLWLAVCKRPPSTDSSEELP